MSEAVRNLVDAIVAQDALETENAFGAAMAEKLAGKLDDMRTEVAKGMFANEQEEMELEPVEDEIVDGVPEETEETVEEVQDDEQ